MTVTRLTTHRVEKVWGRRDLWPGFGDVQDDGEPVGEIWFQHPDGRDEELLVKYLFTSEKLSIQVHPDDAAAQARGYPRGKDEAWVVLAAEPTAIIALGTRSVMSRDELRASALDGSIEDKVDWKSVRAGDVIYSPAGTVHAIGPGLTLVEVQQNVDLTYRLYDYGRPRELHLDEGVAVSNPVPYVASNVPREVAPGRTVLAAGPKLVLERWSAAGEGVLQASADRPVWLIPLAGEGLLDGAPFGAGEVWLADGDCVLGYRPGGDLLVAYCGDEVEPGLWSVFG